MGNHDWQERNDGTAGNGFAQIEYSQVSERWTYPDLFYTIAKDSK
jgi:hypothetical protein